MRVKQETSLKNPTQTVTNIPPSSEYIDWHTMHPDAWLNNFQASPTVVTQKVIYCNMANPYKYNTKVYIILISFKSQQLVSPLLFFNSLDSLEKLFLYSLKNMQELFSSLTENSKFVFGHSKALLWTTAAFCYIFCQGDPTLCNNV